MTELKISKNDIVSLDYSLIKTQSNMVLHFSLNRIKIKSQLIFVYSFHEYRNINSYFLVGIKNNLGDEFTKRFYYKKSKDEIFSEIERDLIGLSEEEKDILILQFNNLAKSLINFGLKEIMKNLFDMCSDDGLFQEALAPKNAGKFYGLSPCYVPILCESFLWMFQHYPRNLCVHV